MWCNWSWRLGCGGCYFEGSSGTFLRAADDHSRSLEEVEEKMARATMIPRANGEVCKSILQRQLWNVNQRFFSYFYQVLIERKCPVHWWLYFCEVLGKFQSHSDLDLFLFMNSRVWCLLWFWQAFNILRYELGQKYNCHYDVFDPAEYGPQKSQRVIILQTLQCVCVCVCLCLWCIEFLIFIFEYVDSCQSLISYLAL